jgi:hypothetical protein
MLTLPTVGRPLATAAVALAFAGLLAVAAAAHRETLRLRISDEIADAHVTMPTPIAARIMAMGHNELAADLAWLRTLIYYGDGLAADHGMPDVERLLATVNRLDPWFHRPYVWGAHATTFRGRAREAEYQSSVDILRRGLAVFPKDWELSWLLGLRLFYDVKAPLPRRRTGCVRKGRCTSSAPCGFPTRPAIYPSWRRPSGRS